MKKLLLSLFTVFILLALPLQALENMWSVFEPESLQESTVTVSDIPLQHNSDETIIVAEDDREEITGKASIPERAVVVIEMEIYHNGSWEPMHCSGSMVGPRTVLTVAHCLFFNKKYARKIRIYATGMPLTKKKLNNIFNNYKKGINMLEELPLANQTSNTSYINLQVNILKEIIAKHISTEYTKFSFPNAKAKQLWIPSKYKQFAKEFNQRMDLAKEGLYDYGIIVLDKDLGKETGWLGLRAMSAIQLYQTNIVIIGRGSDKPEASLWKSLGRIGKVNKHYVYHNADVVGGNSGSPIFKANDPQNVIAISNWGSEDGNPLNRGLRIRQEIVDNINKINKGELEMYHLPNND